MNWKTWTGFAASIALIYLAFHQIELRLVLESLREANYIYLFPIVAIIFINVALRALRWGHLLRPIKKIGFSSLFASILIGFMVNNILPVRMGEIIRAYTIGRSERIKKNASFATIVIERLFDGLVVLGLLVLILAFFNLPSTNTHFMKALRMGGYLSIAVCGVTIVIVSLIKKKTQWFLILASCFTRPFSSRFSTAGVSNILSFKEGLLSIESTKTMLIALFYSLIVWGVFAYAIYLMGFAFGLKLSFSATMMMLVAICLAMMIPSTPGYIGTYHASAAYALFLYNIPLEKALSLSIVFHATNYIPITIAGFVCLWRHHLTLRMIKDNKVLRNSHYDKARNKVIARRSI